MFVGFDWTEALHGLCKGLEILDIKVVESLRVPLSQRHIYSHQCRYVACFTVKIGVNLSFLRTKQKTFDRKILYTGLYSLLWTFKIQRLFLNFSQKNDTFQFKGKVFSVVKNICIIMLFSLYRFHCVNKSFSNVAFFAVEFHLYIWRKPLKHFWNRFVLISYCLNLMNKFYSRLVTS